jgi:hypothetical protein
MTDDSSSNSVLEEKAMTASLSPAWTAMGTARRWLAMASRATGGRAEVKTGSAVMRREGVERRSSGDACARDMEASPRGTAATGSVRSPPRHHVWANKWARLHFIFSKLYNHPNFEIQICVLLNVQNSSNYAGR